MLACMGYSPGRLVREALEAEGGGHVARDGGLLELEGLEHVLPEEEPSGMTSPEAFRAPGLYVSVLRGMLYTEKCPRHGS